MGRKAWSRLREKAEPRLVAFALLGALGSAGLAIGLSVSSALFLVNVGASKLPVVYLCMPLVMAVYTPVSSALLSRMGIVRFYRWVLAGLVVGTGLLTALCMSPPEGIWTQAVFYGASFYAGLWYIALYTLFWSLAGEYFDIREAKDSFPILAAGIAAGSMIGGLSVTFFSRFEWVGELFVLWGLLSLLALLPLAYIGRYLRRLEDTEGFEEDSTLRQRMRSMWDAIRHHRYVPVLGGLLFVVMLLSSLCQFEYLAVLSKGRDEKALAPLLGQLYAGVNLFNMVMNLFVFKHLVTRIGVGRTAMILPISYALVFAGFAVDPNLFVALVGFFIYEGLLWSVEMNNQNFLFNALPSEVRQDLRLVLEGLSEPLATATVGLGLLIAAEVGGGEDLRLLARFGLGGSVVALCFAQVLRFDYVKAVVSNLKAHWLDFTLPVESLTAHLDEAELASLGHRASLDRMAETRLAIRILATNDRRLALDRLLELLPEAGEVEAAQLGPLLDGVLKEGDTGIVRRLMEGLTALPGEPPGSVLEVLGRHRLLTPERALRLASEARSLEQKATAAVGLVNAWHPTANRRGLELIESLYEGDLAERRQALWALGCSRLARYAHVMMPHLEDPDLRGSALEALHELAGPGMTRLVPALLSVLDQADKPSERLLALQILEKIREPDALFGLLIRTRNMSLVELRCCERLVTSIGLKGIPQIIHVLRDGTLPQSARSISARALGKLAPAQLDALSTPLIEAEIGLGRVSIERTMQLETYLHRHVDVPSGLIVLKRLYRDVPRAHLDFILELLSIAGRIPDFELLSTSLRSKSARLRGDALETLEQSLGRALFQRLLPMLGGGKDNETMDEVEVLSLAPLLESALEGRHDLEVAAAVAAAQALDEPWVQDALKRRILRPLPTVAKEVLVPEHGMSPIDKLAVLAACPVLDRFQLDVLKRLEAESEESRVEVDTSSKLELELDPNRLYLIIDGEMEMEPLPGDPETGGVLRAGDLFGLEPLLDNQAPRLSRRARCRSIHRLEIPASTLRSIAQRDASVALGLLEAQFEAGSRELSSRPTGETDEMSEVVEA